MSITNLQYLDFSSGNAATPEYKGIRQAVIQSGVNAALNNSGVMRHGLNTIYYVNQNRPGMAIREGAATIWDAVSGSRK
jgi:hypothetical protein